MFKKGLFVVLLLTLGTGVVWARDVEVSSVSISNVDAGAGTCTINYTLSRTSPTISTSQPVWVFVKYRLTSESDYTHWKDTDDDAYTNDNSDGRFTGNQDNSKNQCDAGYPCTVNKYLADDVGMITSGGSKQITWTWGGSGTDLSSTNSVRVRVYAVEMVLVPDGGSMTFGTDTDAGNEITGGSYDPSSAYYLMKYPCTAEMYAAFLNACVNRHDGIGNDAYDFYASQMDGDQYCRLSKTSGTVGTDAVFAAVSGYEDYAMTYVDWYNAYDFAKWVGLSLPTEEMFEYEASNKAARDFPWGDSMPNTTDNIRCNMSGVSPSNASDVRSYDGYGGGSGLSYHNAAEMSGNVWEWEFTRWYSGSYNSTYSTDSDSYAGYGGSWDRVLRGGNWGIVATWVRAGSRNYTSQSARYSSFGFRAARLP